MPTVDDIYKSHSDKLKAEDLNGQMYTFTISGVEYVEFSDTDKKLVLSFNETDKTLVLNKTNARAIADIHGPDYTFWTGQQIVLFAMPVDYQGKTVQGIRIRAPQAAQPGPIGQPAPQPQPAAHPVHQPLQSAPQPAQGQTYNELNPPPVTDNPFAGN